MLIVSLLLIEQPMNKHICFIMKNKKIMSAFGTFPLTEHKNKNKKLSSERNLYFLSKTNPEVHLKFSNLPNVLGKN